MSTSSISLVIVDITCNNQCVAFWDD